MITRINPVPANPVLTNEAVVRTSDSKESIVSNDNQIVYLVDEESISNNISNARDGRNVKEKCIETAKAIGKFAIVFFTAEPISSTAYTSASLIGTFVATLKEESVNEQLLYRPLQFS
jgi:hypothetical protein